MANSHTNQEKQISRFYFWNCTPGIKVQQIQNNAQKSVFMYKY